MTASTDNEQDLIERLALLPAWKLQTLTKAAEERAALVHQSIPPEEIDRLWQLWCVKDNGQTFEREVLPTLFMQVTIGTDFGFPAIKETAWRFDPEPSPEFKAVWENIQTLSHGYDYFDPLIRTFVPDAAYEAQRAILHAWDTAKYEFQTKYKVDVFRVFELAKKPSIKVT